jgi:mRNA-degrading endonuclease toxin of MazEF toxin-antitoxin module
LILPLRTKTKNGSWYVPLVVDKKQAVVILSQSKTIDRKRLKTRIETINEADFNEIKQKFIDFIT